MKEAPQCTVVIPTYEPPAQFNGAIRYWLAQRDVTVDIVLVDTRQDGCVVVTESPNSGLVRSVPISKTKFTHSVARNLGLRQVNAEFVCFAVQDVVPDGEYVLAQLIDRVNGSIIAAFAKQVSVGVDSLVRELNYPDRDRVISAATEPVILSNACAVYRTQWLLDVGGFPNVVTNEDREIAKVAFSREQAVAYVSTARVSHDHGVNLVGRFRRGFDYGVYLADLKAFSGTKQSNGLDKPATFFIQLAKAAIREGKFGRLALTLVCRTAHELGAGAGRVHRLLPESVSRRLSQCPGRWR